MGGRSHEDIKNCQVNDELVGPIYQAKIKGVKPSEQSVKGRDPKFCRLVQLWDQLVVKDQLLWRLFEDNDGTEYICDWLCENPPCLRILYTFTKTAVKS